MPKTEVKVTLDQKEVFDAIIATAREAAGALPGGARMEICYNRSASGEEQVAGAVVYFQQTKK